MLENSAELHATNCKLVLSWESENDANDSNTDIEDVFPFCYLDELYKNITQSSEEFVECLKRIFAHSTYSDQLRNQLLVQYPDIAFSIGKAPSKRYEELLDENERLKSKHENEMLSVRNDFSQQIDELLDKQEKLICENKRLIDEHENEKRKMSNEMQKINDLLDKQTLELDELRQELDTGYKLEISDDEILHCDVDLLDYLCPFPNTKDSATNSNCDSNLLEEQTLKLDELRQELDTGYKLEISDDKIFHGDVDISDLCPFPNTEDNATNSNCDPNSSMGEPTVKLRDFVIRLGYKSDQGSLHHRCLEEPTCKQWNSQFEKNCIDDQRVKGASSLISNYVEPFEQNVSAVCNLQVSNDNRVEVKKSLFTPPLPNKMTEDEADALLSELPECEANPDLFVDPFPIDSEILTDSFWTEERQKDQNCIHKLIKLFSFKFKQYNLSNILDEDKLSAYKQYRKRNQFRCNEIKCLIRNKRFPTQNHLQAHVVKFHHDGVKIFPCVSCYFPLFSKNELECHLAKCCSGKVNKKRVLSRSRKATKKTRILVSKMHSSSSLINTEPFKADRDLRVRVSNNVPFLPRLQNEMTEDKADALLSELPECQSNPDSFVYPFPIAGEKFTDSYWSEERQKDVTEVHKLTKLFGYHCKCNLSKFIFNEDDLITYFHYREQYKFRCNEVRCLIRNKRFPSYNHLQAHVLKHHRCGLKVYPCIYCDFPSSSEEEYKLHHFNCTSNPLKENRERRRKESDMRRRSVKSTRWYTRGTAKDSK